MDFNDVFGPKPHVIHLYATDRWEAIDELVGHLVVANKIRAEHSDIIAVLVKQRERGKSTAIGLGMAVPHASSDFVSDVIGNIGRSQKGIEFGAPDGEPVKLVLLFLVPAGQFQKHLNTLANKRRSATGGITARDFDAANKSAYSR